MKSTDAKNIDEYIAGFPKEIQKLLNQVRATIRKAAPDAEETIKYAIPTYVLHGNLVFFAAYKNHIGFYAAPTGHEAFKKELSPYKSGKGSVQFPLDQPMPLSLISKIVRFRVQENLEKIKAKKKQRGSVVSTNDAFSSLSAPALRALKNNGITSLEQLSKFSEKEILEFHGMGKSSIPKLRLVLEENNLKFKEA